MGKAVRWKPAEYEYFGIDLKLTWRVVRFKIPELKEKILEIKEDLEGG